MKEYYIFYLLVNNELQEMIRLRFIGYAGENKWLHFQNPKTLENHLCSPAQFPVYTIKGRQASYTYKYEEDQGNEPILKEVRRQHKKQPTLSIKNFFRHQRNFS